MMSDDTFMSRDMTLLILNPLLTAYIEQWEKQPDWPKSEGNVALVLQDIIRMAKVSEALILGLLNKKEANAILEDLNPPIMIDITAWGPWPSLSRENNE